MTPLRCQQLGISLPTLVLCVTFVTSPLWGQTLKGTILGTLTDSSHAVVPDAQGSITDVNTNFRRTETSNDSGFHVFANLGPGSYRVEAEYRDLRKVTPSYSDMRSSTTIRACLEP